jgi:hypothetical protein
LQGRVLRNLRDGPFGVHLTFEILDCNTLLAIWEAGLYALLFEVLDEIDLGAIWPGDKSILFSGALMVAVWLF